MGGTLLEVEDLHVHFPTPDGVVKAVNGISYSLAKQEILAIVGESGSGKSVGVLSLLRLIPDRDCHLRGSVHFEGSDLLQLNDCLLYTSPSPRDATLSRMPSSA